MYTSTDPLMIGRNSGATARDWNGWIDDVSIYDNALTDADIKVLAGWTYTISGTVGTVDGVTMGGLPGNPVTSGGGNYTCYCRLRLERNGYTFKSVLWLQSFTDDIF